MVELWHHQKKAIEKAKDLAGFALFFEMGTGKTRTVIEILRAKMTDKKRHMRILIFCPPIVIQNWKDEWGKYSNFPLEKIVPLIGSAKKRRDTFNKESFVEDTYADIAVPKIFITNYEALLMRDLYAAFQEWEPEAIVFDESHKLKSFKAKRSKLAEALANPYLGKQKLSPPLKYLLTGTPVLNSPMDLFMPYLIMDGGKTFGGNYWAFRARYFVDRNAGMPKQRYFPKWEIMTMERDGRDALEEINEKLKVSSVRVEKKDCLDLPPLVRQTLLVDMAPDQARVYKEMKNDFVASVLDHTVSATLAITKGLRLMQIASGYIKSVDGEEVALERNPKEAALEELLTELTPHSKVLVWMVWRQNYGRVSELCRRLGIGYVEVHGGISAGKKLENVKKFNSDPTVRVFIGHPGSGGIGINLVSASYSIFYSRNFSLEQDLQAESRNHRGGSEIHQSITRIDLITRGTIDELVQKRLANKVKIGEKVLRDLSLEMTLQET